MIMIIKASEENNNEQDTCDNQFEYVKFLLLRMPVRKMIMSKILVIIILNMSNATLILSQLLFHLLVEIQVWIFILIL